MVVSVGCADMRGAWNSEAVAAAGQGFVAGLAHGRVPQPDVYAVSPDHPDYRYFTSTLAPTKGLKMEQRAAHFPRAADLAKATPSALPFTDEVDLVTWALQYRVRLPAAGDADVAAAALARLELPPGHASARS